MVIAGAGGMPGGYGFDTFGMGKVPLKNLFWKSNRWKRQKK